VIVPWGGDCSQYEAVVIRGTWDYIEDRAGFLAWAASIPPGRLANPYRVLEWNTDKRYLRSLGVPTVPTTWSDEPGWSLPADGEFVVKPAVSAGARNSARHTSVSAGLAHVAAIEAAGDVAMIQPYLPSVDSVGETGTYVFGGSVSHAVRKMGVLDAGAPPLPDTSAASIQRVGPAEVDPALAAFALDVVSRIPEPVLYARVDTVPGPDGSPLLIELEATEPYLFLEHSPDAAARFAAAVCDWLR
jgi:hypothetical protein